MNYFTMDELTKLVDDQEKNVFIYKDVPHPEGGDSYRIFNYRLASFSDFRRDPRLLWCRGTMFNIRTGELVSRPMPKFFNLHEWVNNSTSLPEHDWWESYEKFDGSLVSTYVHSDGQVYLKSKYSLESSQAVQSTALLNEIRPDIKDSDLIKFHLCSTTLNYEFVSPDNLVVVPYGQPDLRLLNHIDNDSGIITQNGPCMYLKGADVDTFAEDVYNDDETLHEGYVVVAGQTMFKLKTNRYLAAHRIKDDISSTKRMVELVVNGNADDIMINEDLKADPDFFQRLLDKLEHIKDTLNLEVSLAEIFYEANKGLDRKDYAVKLKSTKDVNFTLAINKYLGRDMDLFKFAMNNLSLFETDTN